jgi:hypothetical protein
MRQLPLLLYRWRALIAMYGVVLRNIMSSGNIASGVVKCCGFSHWFLNRYVAGLFEVLRFPVHDEEAVGVVFAVVGFRVRAVVALRIGHFS